MLMIQHSKKPRYARGRTGREDAAEEEDPNSLLISGVRHHQEELKGVLDHAATERQRVNAYVAKAKRQCAAETPHVARLRGKGVFFDKSVALPEAGRVADILNRNGAGVVATRPEADVFVVKDVESPGQRVQFAAALIGGVVCTFVYLETRGAAGVAVAYKPQVAVHRVAWCSAAFIAAHPSLHEIIRGVCERSESKWTLYEPDCMLVFAEKATRLNAQKKFVNSVAFVTSGEKANPAISCVRTRLTGPEALLKYVVLDPVRCAVGACHR